MFSDVELDSLLCLAKGAIMHGLVHQAPPILTARHAPEKFKVPSSCYVSLRFNGANRGCIGNTDDRWCLHDGVQHNAYRAAFKDPRFSPVTETMVPHLMLQVHVIKSSARYHVATLDELRPCLQPNKTLSVYHNGSTTTLLAKYLRGKLAEEQVDMLLKKAKLLHVPLVNLRFYTGLTFESREAHLPEIKI